MQGTGFQVLLFRGAEWVAKEEVTQAVPSDFLTADKVIFRKAYKAFIEKQEKVLYTNT